MEGKEWAKWKVKTEKMQLYWALCCLSFVAMGILLPWIIWCLYALIDNLSKGYTLEEISSLVAVTLGVLLLMILCFFGGMHYYEKAKEIEKEIEEESE